tara:strand:- start:33 stop:788 length:756 start_codon:yes stop_codon:yes gene_type:complete
MKQFLTTTVAPNIDTAGATAYGVGDVLFDWFAFEIPLGAAKVTSFSATIVGTESASANVLDIDILFARSINGVAPTTLGTVNGPTTKPLAAACRRNIFSGLRFDASKRPLFDADGLLAYSVYSNDTASQPPSTILSGHKDPETTQGFQTIYIAGMAFGAFDFGTGVILNETDSATLAALGTAALDVDGVDPRNVFQVGDEVIAADGALLGTIKSIPSDVLINLESAHVGALANDDEICFRQPIRFEIGLEY